MTTLGTWLRAQREERGWSRGDMARRLLAAGKQTGGDATTTLDNMSKNVRRWEADQIKLSERYRLQYCRAFGIKPAQFGPQPDMASSLVPQPRAGLHAGADASTCGVVAYRGIEAPGSRQSTVRQEVLMAAHEGSDHAAQAEEHGIGDITLEQLRADLIRLAHLSDTGEPLPVFMDLRRVRERVFRLLERRLWPAEQTDLYFILGVLNGLMGLAASRLDYPESAEELIRSGWVYATAIDHRPLLGALRLQLSAVAWYRGLPLRSRDLAADGLRYITSGPTAAELHLVFAHAAATLGDPDPARRAVSAAHEAREATYHDELLDIGGEFALSLATHHSFAGAALAEVNGAEADAAAEIERAVGLYEAGPRPGEHHWFGARAMASIDLATLRLRAGALDGAVTAIEPALALSPARRISSVMTHLQRVRTELAAPVFRRSAQARQLDERIEEFARDSVTAGLHALPGGPA